MYYYVIEYKSIVVTGPCEKSMEWGHGGKGSNLSDFKLLECKEISMNNIIFDRGRRVCEEVAQHRFSPSKFVKASRRLRIVWH